MEQEEKKPPTAKRQRKHNSEWDFITTPKKQGSTGGFRGPGLPLNDLFYHIIL
jgi:hypothetical protein